MLSNREWMRWAGTHRRCGRSAKPDQASKSARKPTKEDPTRGRVPEQRDDEVAVLIEPGGAPDEWHDAVEMRELEQMVDLGVTQPLRDRPKGELSLELGGESSAPACFVDPKRRRAELVPAERADQDVGRGRGAEE